ncbi:MAG: hypothetical protein AAFV80_02920 [Bacteroidota bacterium]
MSKKNKTVSLLQALRPKELERFEVFLQSPFFGYSENVLRTYQCMVVDYPTFHKGFRKQDLYFRLFPEQAEKGTLSEQEDKTVRYLLSDLNKALQHFVLYQRVFTTKPQQQFELGQAFSDRGLIDQLPSVIQSVRKNAQKSSQIDPEYYYERFRVSEIAFHYLMATQNRGQNNGLQHVIDQLDNYYLAAQLRYYCAAVNRENILKVKYSYPMMAALFHHIETQDYTNEPYILIYFQVLQMLQNPEGKVHYHETKRLMTDHQSVLSDEERKQIYWFMINFCSATIKEGDLDFLQERHQLYSSTLEDGIWHIGPYLHSSQFILIVQNALALGLNDWTNRFIETYVKELNPKMRSSLKNLGLAYWHFAQADFESAHNHWIQIDSPEDFFFGLYYRVLILKIFFEKSMDEGLDSYEGAMVNALESLRFYLSPTRNQNMSETNRKSYSNFVKMTRRLLRIRYSWIDKQPKKSIQRLLKDLQDTPFLEERKWLLSKAEHFRNLDLRKLKKGKHN